MACIEKIYSVSALVGNGVCNANCQFCSGKYLRKDAGENQNYYRNLEVAIKLSARYGGWSLALTSSGEATCDPDALTRALVVYQKCTRQGAYFPNVVLFTNGILLANRDYCSRYLKTWRDLGLNNIAISVHSPDMVGQAKAYGLKDYPPLLEIVSNVKRYGIGVRATLLLRKGEVDNAARYKEDIRYLTTAIGIDNITSWPIGNPDGTRNEYTPSRLGLLGIRLWLRRNAKLCHGHVWGGGVYDYKGNILRYTTYVTKHNPRKDFVRQLVVFHDGTVAYSWIREGALCMK